MGTICEFVRDNFASHLHFKQVESINNAVLGVLSAGKATIAHMGRGLSRLQNSAPKHAIKQIDRLLSNDKFCVNTLQESIIKYVLSDRKEIFIAVDWTHFNKDNQVTITAKLATNHGRATP